MKKTSLLCCAAFLAATTVAEAQLGAGYGYNSFQAPDVQVEQLLKTDYNHILPAEAQFETAYDYIFADGTMANSRWSAAEGKAFEIGFDFPFAGEVMTHFVPMIGGGLKLGNTETLSVIANNSYFTNFNEAYNNTVFFGNSSGNQNTANLEMGYVVVGTAPARMLVVGYRNYGLSESDAVNMAIALLENGDIYYGVNGTTALTGTYNFYAGVRASEPSDLTCVGGAFDQVRRATSATATLSAETKNNSVFSFIYPTDVVAPTAQPTDLVFDKATATTLSGSFTAAEADYYLVVISEGALDAAPEAQKTYAAGDALGNGTVVDYTTGTSFNAYDLKGSTNYTVTVFASNKYGFNGPQYNTTNPLVGTAATTPGKPGPLAIYDITKESFTLDVASDEAGDDVFVVVSDITHNPGNFGVRAFHGEISAAYKTGDDIEGGGKVAYFGPAATGIKLEGLKHSQDYYFLAYSYSPEYGFSVEPDTVMAQAITTIELPWAYTTYKNSLYNVPTGWESNLEVQNQSNYGTLVHSDTTGYQLWANGGFEKMYAKIAPMHINQVEAALTFDFAAFTWSRFTNPQYNAYTWKDEDKLYAVIYCDGTEETVPLLDGESFVEPDTLGLTSYSIDLTNYFDKTIQVEIAFDVTSGVQVTMENFKAEGKDAPLVSISSLNREATEGKTYDLQGRRATEAAGLKIKDGKVIMVK